MWTAALTYHESIAIREHNFTLTISGSVDEHLGELFDASCGDALFGDVDGVLVAAINSVLERRRVNSLLPEGDLQATEGKVAG